MTKYETRKFAILFGERKTERENMIIEITMKDF